MTCVYRARTMYYIFYNVIKKINDGAYVEFFLLIDACKLYFYTYFIRVQYYPTILYDLFSKIRYKYTILLYARFSYLIFQFKFWSTL